MTYVKAEETLKDFIAGAASYFGLPVDQVVEGKVHTEHGCIEVVLHVQVTADDLAGIAGRMKAMAEVPPVPHHTPQPAAPTDAELREEYNTLTKADRSRFGAFHRYKAWRMDGGPEQQQATIDLPPHVYLAAGECTAQQRAMAIGQDEKGQYAIAVEDLTEAQRIEHVPGYEGSLGGGLPAEQTGWLPARLVPEEQRKTALSERYVQATEAGPIAGVRWFLLDRTEMTAEQLALCKGKPEPTQQIGPSGVTADQLRQAYVERTMAAHERLNGADGKPTSNADDFGGLPG